MEIKISEIVSRVIKNLDENEEIILEKMEYGYPETCLPQLISDILPDIAEETIREASLHDIDEWQEMTADVEWIEPGHGELELPKDFLRLISFRMSDWKRSVSSVVFEDSDNYPLIFNPRPNRRGYRCSPAVAITAGATRRKLEFIGSTEPGAYILQASYLPLPYDTRYPDILNIPRSLLHPLISATSSAVRLLRT